VWDRRGRIPPAGRFEKYAAKIHCGKNYKTKITGSQACRTGGKWAAKYGDSIIGWDIAPPPEYFLELARVSKHQIIFGGNYFNLPPSRNFIVWKKLNISETFSMAMAEFAWTDIPGNAKVIECAAQDKYRFHPTQKPVFVYKKLLQWYSKPGDRILDTHLGSGTSAIACLDMGLDLTGCEIDAEYYEKAARRVEKHRLQHDLFEGAELRGEKTLFNTEGAND
jgi:site-specific DNA-methyltransferase (adenine-specific)